MISRLLLSPRARLLAALCSSLVLWACSARTESPATPASAPASPASAPATASTGAQPAASAPAGGPVTVTTAVAVQRDVKVELSTSGTVAAIASVDVKAQESSPITAILLKEGQNVRKGQLLFTLDSRADEANLAKAQAQLARDQASLADAQRQLDRSRQLKAQNFISQGAVDTALAQVEGLSAALESDKASIEAARVSLSYTRITAPISGRAGAVTVTPGTAVTANQTTLVTITQLDPIAVAFSVPQRNVQDLLGASRDPSAAVSIRLPEQAQPLRGRLAFVDNTVDAATGTLKAKAYVPNREERLWPGAAVEVRQTVRTLPGVTVVPQASIIQGQRGSFIFVVEGGLAQGRPIKVLYSDGTDAAVSGVKPGDKVVVDGKQNLRPRVPVQERKADAATGERPGAAAPASARQATP